jgi:hypothetical protein
VSFGSDYATISTAMTQLASTSGGLCTVKSLSQHAAKSNREIHFLEIAAPGAPANRPVALIIAGVHARELAPPPAVLQFAINIVKKYPSGDVEYPAFTDQEGNVPYARWTKSNKTVHRILDALTLLVVPVVNPDGRDHVLHDNDAGWRGNRNTAACAAFGVDLNRNFDIGWDSSKYYSAADESKIIPHGTNPRCSEEFRGPSAGSEKETKGIQDLIDSRDVRCFIDVHSAGRRIMTPWGLAGNQSDHPDQAFNNHTLDRGPGKPGRSVLNGAYKEFMPDARPDQVFTTHNQLAERMRRAILDQAGPNLTAQTRSTYKSYQIPDLYKELLNLPTILPVPGTSVDYALSRQLKPSEPGPAFAFAMECGWLAGAFPGADPVDEGGFVPKNDVKYKKIEREVHAALWALLTGLAGKKASKKAGKGK